MSLIDPISCGFAKVFVYEQLTTREKNRPGAILNNKQDKGRLFSHRYDLYNSNFEVGGTADNFHVPYKIYVDNFPRIVPNVQCLGIRHSNVKKEPFSIFYSKSWGKLSLEEKHKHTVFNCQGCLHKKVFNSFLTVIFCVYFTHLF